MPVARAVLAFALAAVVLVGGGGCGGDGGDGGSEGRGGVAAEAWAAQVCQALSPWRREIDALTARAQQRMDAAAGAAQAKTGLVELLAGAEAASERARDGIARAGQPDADNGRLVAAEFADSLRRTRDAYGRAKTTISTLPTAQAKTFYDAVSAAFGQLNTEYASGALDLGRVNSTELKKAFAEVPACR